MPTERAFVEVPRPSAQRPHMGVILGPVLGHPGFWWVVTGTSKLHPNEGTPVVFEPNSRAYASARVLSTRTYFYACHLERVAESEIRELPNAGRCVPDKFVELRNLVRERIAAGR